MRNFIFLDSYALANPGTYGKSFLYRVKAEDEDAAWERFARFARAQFGFKRGTSVERIKEEYSDTITLYDADLHVVDLSE